MFGQFLSYKNALAPLLALTLTACGDFTVEQPKDETKGEELDEDQGEGSEKGPADGEAGEPEEIKPVLDEHSAGDDVSVSVSVEVTVDRHGGDADEIAEVRYAPIERGWQETVDATPEGYRLADRSEVLALIDAGVLEELGADDALVWTATEDDHGAAYMVDCRNGNVVPGGKTIPLEALYVREAE